MTGAAGLPRAGTELPNAGMFLARAGTELPNSGNFLARAGTELPNAGISCRGHEPSCQAQGWAVCRTLREVLCDRETVSPGAGACLRRGHALARV